MRPAKDRLEFDDRSNYDLPFCIEDDYSKPDRKLLHQSHELICVP